MKILLLTHLFNSLAQRLFVELRGWGHEVTVELDIADSVTEEALALAAPDLVLAPFMKRRIPESVWSVRPCLVLHPGPPGDRGPSALDRAILDGEREWGVTWLQATGEYDAGPVWAWAGFAMRDASKGELYRREVTDAAVRALRQALARWRPGPAGWMRPLPAPDLPWHGPARAWRPLLRAAERAIDWQRDSAAEVLRKIRSADGSPGAAAELFGRACRLFDAHPASAAALGSRVDPALPGDLNPHGGRAGLARPWGRSRVDPALPGDLNPRGGRAGLARPWGPSVPDGPAGSAVARRGPALLVRAVDGGLWVGHVRCPAANAERPALKLAATRAFAAEAAALPELALPLLREAGEWDELRYRETHAAGDGGQGPRVGWLEFDFHNGALSTRQCGRLLEAIGYARRRPTQVLVLAGGAGFFANGIHLHDIEAAADVQQDSAADASWRNINAIDDVALAILQLSDRLTVATLRGNAAAGGCFLALAADEVWAHGGVVINPHYKNMGNLYGSEYWTYLLPRRLGVASADDAACQRIVQGRLPLGAAQALALGLVDRCLADDARGFDAAAMEAAHALAVAGDLADRIAAKAARRAADESTKPLAQYRAEELARMQRNFYGFDPSYHVARHHFVARKPQAWTPRHLALHRAGAGGPLSPPAPAPPGR